MRLRQIALAAGDLGATTAALSDVLGLGEPFHDPGVGVFGLENAVFAIGETFLAMGSPVGDAAPATSSPSRFRAAAGSRSCAAIGAMRSSAWRSRSPIARASKRARERAGCSARTARRRSPAFVSFPRSLDFREIGRERGDLVR